MKPNIVTVVGLFLQRVLFYVRYLIKENIYNFWQTCYYVLSKRMLTFVWKFVRPILFYVTVSF